ncbi:MAG: nucleotide exchange factor GrpE [Peptococcaceae bacterium]|nr:nucleotide exchange factor GrpE [Peptococcaceae bacterium]
MTTKWKAGNLSATTRQNDSKPNGPAGGRPPQQTDLRVSASEKGHPTQPTDNQPGGHAGGNKPQPANQRTPAADKGHQPQPAEGHQPQAVGGRQSQSAKLKTPAADSGHELQPAQPVEDAGFGHKALQASAGGYKLPKNPPAPVKEHADADGAGQSEKPANDKKVSEKPTNEKPAREKPTSEKVAGEKTVSEKTKDRGSKEREREKEKERNIEKEREREAQLAIEEQKRVQVLADDYYAKLQRLQAEFDNFRKRSVKEKGDVIRYATENLILQLLPVVDNFERALAAAAASQDFEVLSNGVDMIYKQMLKILNDEGVEVIETEGREFDPNLHEAMLSDEVAGQEPGMVLQEFEKGYRLKDKVIRHSRVKVSS